MAADAKHWLGRAEMDLVVARHLYDCYHPCPVPVEVICFQCQQAAEKAIKAVILSHGVPGGLPKKHDLSFLLKQIKNYEEIAESYYDHADLLTPYGVAARYPDELNLEPRHAKAALLSAGELVRWARGVIDNEADQI